MFLLSLGLFLLAFALPLGKGFLEIVRPRDDGRLVVDREYSRDPRFFGNSFRAKIATLLAIDAHVPRTIAFLDRGDQEAYIAQTIDVATDAQVTDVLIATQTLRIADNATVLDVFGGSCVTLGRGVRAGTVCSDGSIDIGAGSTIERWIDAQGRLNVGPDCELGISASATQVASIGNGTDFKRIFGHPVVAVASSATPWHDTISLPSDAKNNLIFADDAHIDADSVIGGSIKANGQLTIGNGTRIAGNVIGRRNVAVGSGVRIVGHAFAEDSLQIGSGTQVGSPQAVKTAYGGRSLTLENGACVYGWAATDGVGRIR